MRKVFIFASGFILSFVLIYFSNAFLRINQQSPRRPLMYGNGFLPNKPHQHGEFDEFMNKAGNMDPKLFKDEKEHSHIGEDLIAKELFKKVRVFCWILTNPNAHKTKAVHVKATWAKRCNKYIFISSEEDPTLPAIDVKIEEGRNHLWGKTKAAFSYLYKNELNNFDFFLKADDDTFVVLENLRYMLRDVDPEKPWLFGRKFKPFVKQGYMSGGAGYVISRAGLRIMMEKGFDNLPNCRKDEGGAEDVHFGQCAEGAGVVAGDSRDSLGRERFHPFPPDSHLRPIDKGNWLWSYNFYPLKTGTECCSDTSVSFHYIAPAWMYILEYYIYHLQPYGIVRDLETVRRMLGSPAAAHAAEPQHAEIEKDRTLAKEELEKARQLRSEAEQTKTDARQELMKAQREAKKIKEAAIREVEEMKAKLKAEKAEKSEKKAGT